MSVKPDYEAAIEAVWKAWREARPVTASSAWAPAPDLLARAAVDAALGDDPVAFAVAALIAEGGETQEVVMRELKVSAGRTVQVQSPLYPRGGPGRYLVYGPIPAEEETPT